MVCNYKFLLVFLVVSFPFQGFADETQKYVSPDGKLQALVIPVGKVDDRAGESRVEIRDSGDKMFLTKSFASKDGEHGYVVYEAAWTPDSQFFVFSTGSSGGHQPWHSPTYFYCRSDRRLRVLDDYVGPVTDPNFQLTTPDIIHITKLKKYGDRESVAAQAKLSDLVKQKPK